MWNSERAGWYLALLQPLLAVTQGFGCFIKDFSSKVNINHPVGRFSLSVSLWLFSVRDKEMWRGSRQAKGRVRRNKIPYLMHAWAAQMFLYQQLFCLALGFRKALESWKCRLRSCWKSTDPNSSLLSQSLRSLWMRPVKPLTCAPVLGKRAGRRSLLGFGEMLSIPSAARPQPPPAGSVNNWAGSGSWGWK